jgi:hypothetical protein
MPTVDIATSATTTPDSPPPAPAHARSLARSKPMGRAWGSIGTMGSTRGELGTAGLRGWPSRLAAPPTRGTCTG